MKMKIERDRMELEGVVISTSNSKFKVAVNDEYVVLCTLCGKIRKNDVRVLVEDRVLIEVSPYDPSLGRIVYRLKANQD